MQSSSIGEIIWIGIVAGIVGTIGMTVFLNIITKTGIAHADMVRAVGSLLTKSLNNAFNIGLLIHSGWGIIFGIIYVLILVSLKLNSSLLIISVGAIIGFIHGFAVSLLLVVAVAEHHPLEQFKNPGFAVAVAHFVAHLIFGTLVGLITAMMV